MTTRVIADQQTALEDYEDFLDLLKQLTPDRRRIVDALLRKIAERIQTAAMGGLDAGPKV